MGQIMNVQLIRANNSRLIENLFQYYIYDMSEFIGLQPTPEGTYLYEEALSDVREYWNLPEHYPYLIYADKILAGFCLVRKFPYEENRYDMGQFFVLKASKGRGIGKQAFRLAVEKHPGNWLVRMLPENTPAQQFWPKVIASVTAGEVVKSFERYRSTEMDFLRFQVN